MPWYQRLLLIAVSSVVLVLLGTAASLNADARGFGTHQQLGLAPCTFTVLFNVRCPSCGMTTSWAHLMRGRVVQSLRSNVGGTLLGLLSLVIGPWWLISGIRGRWFVRPVHDWTLAVVALVILVVTCVDWIVRLTWMA